MLPRTDGSSKDLLRRARAGGDEQPVAVAVVAAVELDDDVPPGRRAGEPKRRHRRFGAGVDEADHVAAGHPVADRLGERHLRRGRGAERRAGLQHPLQRLGHDARPVALQSGRCPTSSHPECDRREGGAGCYGCFADYPGLASASDARVDAAWRRNFADYPGCGSASDARFLAAWRRSFADVRNNSKLTKLSFQILRELTSG